MIKLSSVKSIKEMELMQAAYEVSKELEAVNIELGNLDTDASFRMIADLNAFVVYCKFFNEEGIDCEWKVYGDMEDGENFELVLWNIQPTERLIELAEREIKKVFTEAELKVTDITPTEEELAYLEGEEC